MGGFLDAMNVASLPYKPSDEQCLRVARYILLRPTQAEQMVQEHANKSIVKFLKEEHSAIQKMKVYFKTIDEDMDKAVAFLQTIPTIKISDLVSELDKNNENVFQVARLLSQSNMIVFASYNRDIMTALFHSYLPENYSDYGGFFDLANQKGVQEKKFDMNDFLGRAPKKEEIPKISRQEMIHKLHEMDFVKALSVFRYITQEGITLSSHHDNMVTDSCSKPFGTVYTEEMQYYFSHEDLQNMTVAQEQLLRDIVVQSNQGIGDRNIDKRFQIKEEHIPLLIPHKNFILNNKLFTEAQIRVDISEPTTSEKLKNLLLFWGPHLLVIILPDLVHSQITGIRQNAVGIIGCIIASGAFGGASYRLIDSCNSNVPQLASWFGSDNHRIMHRGGIFMSISTLNSVCTVITQKLLSLHMLPCTILAGALSLFRTWRVVVSLKNMETAQNKNPFQRANKDGLPFTLKDLVNGPKFKNSELT